MRGCVLIWDYEQVLLERLPYYLGFGLDSRDQENSVSIWEESKRQWKFPFRLPAFWLKVKSQGDSVSTLLTYNPCSIKWKEKIERKPLSGSVREECRRT